MVEDIEVRVSGHEVLPVCVDGNPLIYGVQALILVGPCRRNGAPLDSTIGPK